MRRLSRVRRIFTIYCITCIQTKKRYVGVTIKTLEERWLRHVRSVSYKSGGCPALVNAIRKYGPDSFRKIVLCVTSTWAKARTLEKSWIRKLSSQQPNGYNISPGGKYGPFHPSTLAKMSARRLAWTPEQLNSWRQKFKASYTPEKRHQAGLKREAAKTPERRREIARKAAASLTPEQRSARVRLANSRKTAADWTRIGKKISESRTRAQRVAASRKSQAARSAKERSESVRKSWLNRDSAAQSKAMRDFWKNPKNKARMSRAIRLSKVKRS